MKSKPIIFLIFLGIVLTGAKVFSSAPSPLQEFRKIRSHPEMKKQLEEIVKVGILRAFGEKSDLPPDLAPLFLKPLPVFVTFQKGDRVRGCMGVLNAQQGSLSDEIIAQVKKALSGDPRHYRISREELAEMKVFVTAVGNPVAVQGIQQISPARDAVYLRHGSKEAVVLPGEAKTQRYLLAFLKAKAGLKKGEAFRLYRLPAETLLVGVPFH